MPVTLTALTAFTAFAAFAAFTGDALAARLDVDTVRADAPVPGGVVGGVTSPAPRAMASSRCSSRLMSSFVATPRAESWAAISRRISSRSSSVPLRLRSSSSSTARWARPRLTSPALTSSFTRASARWRVMSKKAVPASNERRNRSSEGTGGGYQGVVGDRPRQGEEYAPGRVIPLKDYNPTRHFPYLTVLLLLANVLVYFFVQRPFESTEEDQAEFVFEVAAIPCEVVTGRPLTAEEVTRTLDDGDEEACDRDARTLAEDPRCELSRVPAECEVFPGKRVWLAMLYSMFLHGSILHIGGNMLFLWIFGNNIEDRMRTVPYLLFYLGSGLVAALAHIAVAPNSTVPVVGASGAVAGVMGAYLVLFPRVPIRTLLIVVFLVLIRDIKAVWLLGFWFLLQFFTSPEAGVAWVAHVGGFVFGAFVALLFRERLRPSRVTLPAY